jgi:hypothetical protein
VQGVLFSHGTNSLVAVPDSAQDYLKQLATELTQFSKLFEGTDLPQPDIGVTRFVRSLLPAII